MNTVEAWLDSKPLPNEKSRGDYYRMFRASLRQIQSWEPAETASIAIRKINADLNSNYVNLRVLVELAPLGHLVCALKLLKAYH